MKILKSNLDIIMFDVDSTLIHLAMGSNGIKIEHSVFGVQYVVPIQEHVDLLKKRYNEGENIVVWSLTGWEWAYKVVKVLGLTKYVSLVMSKPFNYVDDVKIEDWIGDRIYLLNDRNYEQ